MTPVTCHQNTINIRSLKLWQGQILNFLMFWWCQNTKILLASNCCLLIIKSSAFQIPFILWNSMTPKSSNDQYAIATNDTSFLAFANSLSLKFRKMNHKFSSISMMSICQNATSIWMSICYNMTTDNMLCFLISYILWDNTDTPIASNHKNVEVAQVLGHCRNKKGLILNNC